MMSGKQMLDFLIPILNYCFTECEMKMWTPVWLRFFFSNDAWLLLEDIVKSKREANVWFCASCHKDLNGAAVICDS